MTETKTKIREVFVDISSLLFVSISISSHFNRLTWLKAILYDRIHFGVMLEWLKLKVD